MSDTPDRPPARLTAGCGEAWCSLQFRFDPDELHLLREAEAEHGARLVQQGNLDRALALARAAQALRRAAPGAVLVLDEDAARQLGGAALAVAASHPHAGQLHALADRLLGPLPARPSSAA